MPVMVAGIGRWAVGLSILGIALTGCSAADSSRELTVLAASSLTVPFDQLAREFERTHPGVAVVISYGPSSSLAAQVTAGAPADVFASASAATMDQVVAAGHVDSTPEVIATNSMAIAVPPANPAQVERLADLADPAVTVAVCQPEVPCGVGAAEVFANAGLEVAPVTREPDVRAVLNKVQLGEVDAGVVYVSDTTTAGTSIRSIPIPGGVNATTAYPITTLVDAPHPDLAQEFVALVDSPTGTAALAAAGFAP